MIWDHGLAGFLANFAPFFTRRFAATNAQFRKFRKGVGGQRGLARRSPSKARDWGLFSVPFFLCPLRRIGTHFWRTFGALFGGLFVANPFPPTPFRNLRQFHGVFRSADGCPWHDIYGSTPPICTEVLWKYWGFGVIGKFLRLLPRSSNGSCMRMAWK